MSDKTLVNRVAKSGLITLDLETFVQDRDTMPFDLKDFLFKGLVLREKEFRAAMKDHDWDIYEGKVILLHCSADAIVPSWAYMLVTSLLMEKADEVFYGNAHEYRSEQILRAIDSLDAKQYDGERIVVKGCSKEVVPVEAYVRLVKKLQPYVKSLMYGEPCSTVPVYKAKH